MKITKALKEILHKFGDIILENDQGETFFVSEYLCIEDYIKSDESKNNYDWLIDSLNNVVIYSEEFGPQYYCYKGFL